MNFFGLALPLLLGAYSVPLIIDRLGVERFGTLTLVWAVVGYFGLLDFGISRALTKRVAEVEDQAAVGRIVRPGMILMCGIGILLAIILAVGYAASVRVGAVRGDAEIRNSVYLIALGMPFVMISLGQRGILEGRQRFGAANLGRLVLGIATFGMPIPLLTYYPTLDALVAALVGGRIVVLFVQGWACREELLAGFHASFDRQELTTLLRFGGWMTVSNLVSPLMVFLDRFIIGASANAPHLAYYTTPFEVVTRILIVPGAITAALFPKFAKWSRDSSSQATDGMVRGMGLNIMLVAPMVLGLQLFAGDLLQAWLGAEFAVLGVLPMQLLAWGVLANSMAAFPFALLQGMGRPRWIAILHVVELPIYVVLLISLLRYSGIDGAAVAWLFRVAADGLILAYLAARYADARQQGTLIQLIILATAVGMVGLFADFGRIQKAVTWLLASAAVVGYGWKIALTGSALGKH